MVKYLKITLQWKKLTSRTARWPRLTSSVINHVGKYVPLIWCYENDPSRLWSSLSKTHNPRLEEHHPTNPKWGTIYKYLSNIPSKNQAHQKQGQPEKPSECRGAYGDMVTAHGTVTETGFQSRKTASGKTLINVSCSISRRSLDWADMLSKQYFLTIEKKKPQLVISVTHPGFHHTQTTGHSKHFRDT